MVLFLLESMVVLDSRQNSVYASAHAMLVSAVTYFIKRNFWLIVHIFPILYRYNKVLEKLYFHLLYLVQMRGNRDRPPAVG